MTINSEQFADDIFNILDRWECDKSRSNFKTGATLSYVRTLLKEEGWGKLPSNTYDFEQIIESAGFTILPATTKNGYHKTAQVVSI